MPKYHFPIVDGVKLDDPTGVDLKDERQAKIHAERIARQLKLQDIKDRNVVVEDEEGAEILKVVVEKPS